MKKVIEMVVCCMLIVTLVGCKNAVTTNVKIDYGTSAIYTKEDMDSANRLRDVSCIIFHIHPMMFVGMKKILHG